jgi:hypothetical protein
LASKTNPFATSSFHVSSFSQTRSSNSKAKNSNNNIFTRRATESSESDSDSDDTAALMEELNKMRVAELKAELINVHKADIKSCFDKESLIEKLVEERKKADQPKEVRE